MLAPNQVSAPAAIQTSSMPPNDGTARLTSDGWTKIEEPTIVPTTIAVAWVSEMVRARRGAGIVSAIQSVVCRGRAISTAGANSRNDSPPPVDRRIVSRNDSRPPVDRRIVSPDGRGLAGALLVQRLDGREGVGFGGALVGAIAFDAREAKRQAAGILRARLNLVERDFRDDLRLGIHRIRVATDLELEEPFGLPRQHLVGEAFERLAEHHEAAALGIARAEMEIAQPSFAPAAAPLDGEDHEIERARLLHLQPRLTAAAGGIHAVNRLRHHALVASRERARGELGRLFGVRRDDARDAVDRGGLLVEDRDAAGERFVDERRSVEIERIEEHRRDRQF